MSTTARAEYISGLNTFYQKVFGYLFAGVGLTAIASWLISQSPTLVAIASNFIVMLVVFFALMATMWKATPDSSPASCLARFVSFSLLSALFITPYVMMHTAANVTMAFVAACITFSAAALYGYVTKKELAGIGNLVIIGFIAAFIVMMINLFIGSSLLSMLISVAVIPLYLTVTAWDVQQLRDLYNNQQGNSEKSLALYGALLLYINLKGLFIHLLNILGILND